MRVRNREDLVSHGNKEGRDLILDMLETGLAAADPYEAVKKVMRIEGNKLIFDGKEYEPQKTPLTGAHEFDLNEIDRIFVFGAGKGMIRIGQGIEDVLGDRLTGGHLVVKYGDENTLKKISVTFAAHPVPDENCVKGCREMVRQIKEARLTERDLVLTVVGNGVSALMTLPVEGLTIDEVKEVTRFFQIEKGASTPDLNRVRILIDQLKGGKFARMLRPAKMVHILGVDANHLWPGNGYEGLMTKNDWLPSVANYSPIELAWEVIEKYDAEEALGENILNYLRNMPKEMECLSREEFESWETPVYGLVPENVYVEPNIKEFCRERGIDCRVLNKDIFLEAGIYGEICAGIAKQITDTAEPVKPPVALLVFGEKIVTVGKSSGVGGRNQEFCLAAAKRIEGYHNIIVCSVDTDGTDGPGGFITEDASEKGVLCLGGGLVDGYTAEEAREKGLRIDQALSTHATSAPLWELKSAVWLYQNISITDLTIILVL